VVHDGWMGICRGMEEVVVVVAHDKIWGLWELLFLDFFFDFL